MAVVDPLSEQAFTVADWLVEPSANSIRRGDRAVVLEPKVMRVLLCLAARAGEVMSREQLEADAWPGVVVGYDALTSAIIKLRKAFDDSPRTPRVIETLSKKGYRLIAPVAPADATALPVVAPTAQSPLRLARWAVLVVPVLLAAIALWWWQPWTLRQGPGGDAPAQTADKPSIAVLPFANLSGGQESDYFSDGITDEIIISLSKLSGLFVISRSSTAGYKNQLIDIREVGKKLGVRYMLEGSVRRAGGRLRITTQLVDAGTGFQLWSERYDREVKDTLEVQDEITRRIVASLSVELSAAERHALSRRYTNNVEAFDDLLKGQSFYARSNREDNARARELYLHAIELDPAFARAYSAVALTYTEDFRHGWGGDPAASMKHAIDMAQRAVVLDDSIPQTFWALAYVQVFNKQYDQAEVAAEHAIALDPNNADAHTTLAFCRVYQGRGREAIPLVLKAMRLNPNYPTQYPSILGRAYYHTGQYEEAEKVLQHAMEMNPVRVAPHVYLVLTYVALGRLEEASWEAEQIRVYAPDFSLDNLDQLIPISSANELAHIRDDLRRAGLG